MKIILISTILYIVVIRCHFSDSCRDKIDINRFWKLSQTAVYHGLLSLVWGTLLVNTEKVTTGMGTM